MSVREILAGKAVIEVGLRDRIQRGLKGIQSRLQKFGGTVGTLGGAFATAGGSAVAGFGAILGGLAFPVSLAADMEKTRAGFLTLIKDATKTDQLLTDIKKAAASTPFELPELADSAKKLIAFGSSTEMVVGEMMRIGDIAAGINAPIGEIAEIYGKARVQGTLFAEDINQLTGRGIPIIQELAAQFGVADTEVKKLVSDGRVQFKHLEAAFVSLTSGSGAFAGGMAAASQTVLGKWSTLKDGIAEVLRPIGEALIPIIGDLLTTVTGLLVPVGQWIKDNKQLVVLVAGIATAGTAAGGVLLGLGGILIVVSSALSAVGAIAGIVGPIIGAVSLPVVAVGAAVAGLVGVFGYLLVKTGMAADALTFLGGVFGELLGTAKSTMAGVVAAMRQGNITLAAQILWAGIKLAFFQGADSALEGVQYLLENIGNLTTKFMSGYYALLWRAFTGIPKLLWAALKGGASVQEVLAGVMTGSLDLGTLADDSVARAKAELDALQQDAAALPAASTDTPQSSARPDSGQAVNAFFDELNARGQAIEAGQRNPGLAANSAAARKQLDDAIKAANAGASKQGIESPELAEASEVGTASTRKLASSGTFSAAAALTFGLGTDDKPAKQTAKATQQMVGLLKRISRRPGGLAIT